MSQDFLLQVFSWITFPQVLENNIRVISNVFKSLQRYTQVKLHHRYNWCCWYQWQICHQCQRYQRQICRRFQRHRWQIMGTKPGCRHLKVNVKAKAYIYVNSTFQRCPNKIINIFLIEDLFHLPLMSTTLGCTLSCEYLRKLNKIWNGPNCILRGLGEIDSWKKPEVETLVALSL